MASCKQNTDSKKEESKVKVHPSAQKLYDETMKIHDDAMKVMAGMETSHRKLSAYQRSFPANSDQPTEQATTIRNALSQMNKAEDAMYRWMREFNQKIDTLKPVEQESYLTINKMSIQQVSDLINLGTAMGTEAIKKYGLENYKPPIDTTSKK